MNKASDNKLCEIIVASRYLGSMKDEAILAMQELAARRAAGSLFDFESTIAEKMKDLPDFRIGIGSVMKGMF